MSDTIDDLLRALLAKLNRGDIKILYRKTFWWGSSKLTAKELQLPSHYQNSRNVDQHARALIRLSMLLSAENHPQAIQWRMNMVKLGYVIPLFAAVAAIFCTLVGKMPILISLSIISASLGGCTVMLWLSLAVEKQAAEQMADTIEKLRLLPRLREEEALIETMSALPWVTLIPGTLLKIVVKD